MTAHPPPDPLARLAGEPHRRWNPLAGEWVLVSPHRTQRPWQGQVERVPPAVRPAYDPACYLCPGNARAAVISRVVSPAPVASRARICFVRAAKVSYGSGAPRSKRTLAIAGTTRRRMRCGSSSAPGAIGI